MINLTELEKAIKAWTDFKEAFGIYQESMSRRERFFWWLQNKLESIVYWLTWPVAIVIYSIEAGHRKAKEDAKEYFID